MNTSNRPGFRLLSALLGLVLLGFGVSRFSARAVHEIRQEHVLGLSGPLRGLPLPFLWSALQEADLNFAHDRRRAIARWMLWLMPERKDLFLGFAWWLAHDQTSIESDSALKATRLLEALELLEEGAARWPDDHEFPAMAGFHLRHRAAALEGGPALAKAFLEATGRNPNVVAGEYFDRARKLAPEIKWLSWYQAHARLLHAIDAFHAAKPAQAARELREGARLLEALNRDRARLCSDLATHLEGQATAIPPELADRIRADHVLRRWFR